MPSILRKFRAIFKCGTISHYVLVTNGLRSQRSLNTNLPQGFNNIIFDKPLQAAGMSADNVLG